MDPRLTRDRIIEALRSLDSECRAREITGELCIYGGAFMVLVFDARTSTRDVDAVFRPKAELTSAAKAVAEHYTLPEAG